MDSYKSYFEILYRDSDIINSNNQDINVIEKIKGFQHLPDGWDFGQGEAPSKGTIKQAIGMYQYGVLLGFNGDVRPETDAGIILNLFTGEDFVYLTINQDGNIDLRHERGIGIEYEIISDIEKISFEDISKTLTNIKEQCFLSELYTPTNTTPTAEDFQATVSSDTEMEYLSL